MGSYAGITFAKGYNRSFADFKEEFKNVQHFKNFLPKQREAEYKKAYKIATNGNDLRPTNKSKKANTEKGKK